MNINIGDTVVMKKPHPCGEKLFDVLRVGSDVRIVCKGCKRDLTLPRVKLEKAVKRIYPSGEDAQEKLSGKDTEK